MLAVQGTGVALRLRAGNAGSNTAVDHIEVLDQAIAQIPFRHRRDLLVTCDGAGATRELVCHIGELNARPGWRVHYSVGFDLDHRARTAIGQVREDDWQHDGAAGQLDLFGGPTTPVQAPGPTRAGGGRETNDVDLIRHVTGNAARGLYRLVRPSDRVYARADGPEGSHVVRVPRYEEDALHQLVRRDWLALGGTHHLRCGAAALTGAAVLGPNATRVRLSRWDHLARPATWRQPHNRAHRIT